MFFLLRVFLWRLDVKFLLDPFPDFVALFSQKSFITVVDDPVICVFEFFFCAHLFGGAALYFRFAPAAFLFHPFHPESGRCPDGDDGVGDVVPSGFIEEGNVKQDKMVSVFSVFIERFVQFLFGDREEDIHQVVEIAFIFKNDVRQRLPVGESVRSEYGGSPAGV